MEEYVVFLLIWEGLNDFFCFLLLASQDQNGSRSRRSPYRMPCVVSQGHLALWRGSVAEEVADGVHHPGGRLVSPL